MKDYKREIYEVMKEIGAFPNLKGYDYTVSIINDMLTGEMDKSDKFMYIYQKVADKFNSTASRVERAIRHHTQMVFMNLDKSTMSKYLGINALSCKVPNSLFICCIVEYIRINSIEE